MQNVELGDKRSVALEASDKAGLKAVIKYAGTISTAALLMGLDRNKLGQWILPGVRTCHPDTLKKIRKFFKENPSVVGQSMAAA